MADYFKMGRVAFLRGEARESCRFKAADIVRKWTAGWDAASADEQQQAVQRAEHFARLAEQKKVFRWEDSTPYSQGQRGVVEPTSWTLYTSLVPGEYRLCISKYPACWVIWMGAAACLGELSHPQDLASVQHHALTLVLDHMRKDMEALRTAIAAVDEQVRDAHHEAALRSWLAEMAAERHAALAAEAARDALRRP